MESMAKLNEGLDQAKTENMKDGQIVDPQRFKARVLNEKKVCADEKHINGIDWVCSSNRQGHNCFHRNVVVCLGKFKRKKNAKRLVRIGGV